MRGHLYQPSNRPRTGAPGSVRSAATGPAAVLALQRSLGNRAVRRTLARAPTLKESGPTGTFVAEALKYYNEPANKPKSVALYAKHLADKANVPLKALGVPEMNLVFDSGAPYPGAFWHDHWRMVINTTMWSKSQGTKLSDLTPDEAANAAGLIYHEARHAEQRFRVARIAAADSKATTTDKIADELMKTLQFKERPVAMAAAGNPLAKTTANAALRDEAQDWRESTLGRHKPYGEVVHDWEQELLRAMRTIDQMMQKPMEIGGAKDRLAPIVKGWQTSAVRAKFLPKHSKIVAGIKKKSAGDKDVEKNLKAMTDAMKKLTKEWAAIEKGWSGWSLNQKLQQIIDFKPHLYALYLTVHTSYTEEAEEKDAFETGNPVAAAFKAGITSSSSSTTKVPAGVTP